MRLVSYQPAPGCARLGFLLGPKVIDLALAAEACRVEKEPDLSDMPQNMMPFLELGAIAVEAARRVSTWVIEKFKTSDHIESRSGEVISYDLDRVKILAPVPRPPKILCAALNYRAHAEEAKAVIPEYPLFFIKPGFLPVVGPKDKVYRHPSSRNLVFEGELAVVIGKRCHRVLKEEAFDVVVGYTVVNDMSCRDLGKTNIPSLFDWFRVKAFDTSLPMGPCLTTKDEIDDPHKLHLTVHVNGTLVQDGSTEEMVYRVPDLIEFITDYITLHPGDIVATGTPGGSKGALNPGDVVDVEIEKIGILSNIIADRDP
jgi:acylpyruvate hydrolase